LVKIVLVDDHPIVRKGLKSLFETVKDFNVVAETGDGFEAIALLHRLKPNIVLLDLILGGVNGIEIARQITKNFPKTGVLIFSMLASDHYVMESFKAGAKGYVCKDSPSDELIHAIREVASGRRYICNQLAEQPYLSEMVTTNSPDFYRRLTPRERDVYQLSAEGLTCIEIAQRLKISRRTAEAHRANMMRKLGFSRPAALYNFAFQHEVFSDAASAQTISNPGTIKNSTNATRTRINKSTK
jgi:DNA-binding NarL/FixJ family response regulator